MEVKTESIKKESIKEFESLLKEDWKKRDLKEGNIIKATVSEISKKHVFVDLKAKSEGIIPIEEFKISKELEDLKIGSIIEIYLERIETFKGEIIVSREKARRMASWQRMEKAFKSQEVVTGVITNKVKGGMVVNIDSCLCFLPGSQVDTRPLKNMDDLMNKPLKFLCVKLDKARGNIVVSRKAVLSQSRDKELANILSTLKEGMIIDTVVKAILEWGAFLDININGSHADALLHVTDLSYSRVKKTSDLLSVGQTVRCKIIKIDPETKRISCGIKQMHPDPYDNIEKRYKVNGIYDAVVSKCVTYGIFCKLEEGLEGLIYKDQVSWNPKKNNDPSKLLSPSQKIKVKIIELDSEKKRISLSYKQTLENPWDSFLKKNSVGSVIEVKIENIADFGLFCSLKNSELIGMIHQNDVAWNPSEKNLKKFKNNQVIKAKILEADKDKEKIRLGLKQLEKDPFDYFLDKNNGDVITATVKEVLKNGIKVFVGKDENSLFTIKKSDLAKEIEDCRPEIFNKGNKVDCMLVGLNKETRKVSLSIKALEEQQTKEAVKKYGSKDSGGVLGDILGKVLSSGKKKSKNKKKSKEEK